MPSSGTAQCHANFARQRRAQLRANIPPHPDRTTLTRDLDQRTVAVLWLPPPPVRQEFRTFIVPTVFEFDHQPAALEGDLFAVGRMPRIDDEGETHCDEFKPGK